MTETDLVRGPKRMTPLWVIALFLSFTEAVASLALVKAEGTIQGALTAFVIGFPLLVASAFFVILWNRPYVLYPPTEFGGNTDVGSFVGAMKPIGSSSKVPLAIQPTISENATVVAGMVSSEVSEDNKPNETDADDWFVLYQAKEYDKAVIAIRDETSLGNLDKGVTEAIVGHMLLDKDRAEGLRHFEATFTAIPLETEPYTWLANYHAAWQQFDEGIAVLDRGLRNGASAMELVPAKARLLAKSGRYDEAIRALADLNKQFPTSGTPFVAAAQVANLLKKIEQATSAYRMALSLDPQNETALAGLAGIVGASDNYGEAISLYRRLTLLKPTDPSYVTLLGNVYLQAGLSGKAMEAYERADEIADHKQAWIIANIGNLLINGGFHQQASRFLKEAAVMDPSATYTHDRLAKALKAAHDEDEKEQKLVEEAEAKMVVQGTVALASMSTLLPTTALG